MENGGWIVTKCQNCCRNRHSNLFAFCKACKAGSVVARTSDHTRDRSQAGMESFSDWLALALFARFMLMTRKKQDFVSFVPLPFTWKTPIISEKSQKRERKKKKAIWKYPAALDLRSNPPGSAFESSTCEKILHFFFFQDYCHMVHSPCIYVFGVWFSFFCFSR